VSGVREIANRESRRDVRALLKARRSFHRLRGFAVKIESSLRASALARDPAAFLFLPMPGRGGVLSYFSFRILDPISVCA